MGKLSSSCVLCTQCCQFIWIPVLIAPYSVFSNVNSLSNKTVTMFHNLFCTISTKLCMILYIRTVLAFAHLCSRDSHFKLEIIDVTTPGSRSWKLLVANSAAPRCTESSYKLKNSFYVDLLWKNENLAQGVTLDIMKVLHTQFYILVCFQN